MVKSSVDPSNLNPVAVSNDMGSLAWVQAECAKSIQSATAALMRFANARETLRDDELQGVDDSQLRLARQQLHQAGGVLDIVGQSLASRMARAMETVVQRFVLTPETCTPDAAQTLEHAGFALVEFIENRQSDAPRSPLGLFPSWQEVKQLGGADRIHPADLWPVEWRWREPETTPVTLLTDDSADVRHRFDRATLRVLRDGDAGAATDLLTLCLGLAKQTKDERPCIFWKLAAGFFDAMAAQRLAIDLHVKRATSRILLQYVTWASGSTEVSQILARDVLFFCAQANADNQTPALRAVHDAWDLPAPQAAYTQSGFGLYDPAVLAQARRRIEALKVNWSPLAGGDLARLKPAVDQLELVNESLTRLHKSSAPLVNALRGVGQDVARSGQPPSPAVSMETATVLLFLEASFADFDPTSNVFSSRLQTLAERLETVRNGAPVRALEPWMETLYREVSDKQTMGTVVSELRQTLDEIERNLDQFFRHPDEINHLERVPDLMAQMRGVLSVLGLDDAATAMGRMREQIERIGAPSADSAAEGREQWFETLGDNLGTMGFLVDTLSYQPALARDMFFWDRKREEFTFAAVDEPSKKKFRISAESNSRLISNGHNDGAQTAESDAVSSALTAEHFSRVATQAVLEDRTGLAEAAQRAAKAAREGEQDALDTALADMALAEADGVLPEMPAEESGMGDLNDDDLHDIFVEEARETLAAAGTALQSFDGSMAPAEVDAATEASALATLHRAFHTLKGSARLMGLSEFGEAAWSVERLLDFWLTEQRPADDRLCAVVRQVLDVFGHWVGDLAQRKAAHWRAEPMVAIADALRVDGEGLPLSEPVSAAPEPIRTQGAEPTQAAESMQAIDESADGSPWATTREMVLDLDSSPITGWAKEDANGVVTDVDLTGAQPSVDVQMRQVGPLRIAVPLFDVYLDEAEAGSTALEASLLGWLQADAPEPVPLSAIECAHALAGSSATVGFNDLSDLAHAMENALQRLQISASVGVQDRGLLHRAADEVRRMLHAFAGGTLKPVSTELLHAVENLQGEVRLSEVLPAIGMSDPGPITLIGEDDLDALPPAVDGMDVAADVVDSLDGDLFDVFSEEADQLLAQLSETLRQWVDQPDDEGAHREVLRLLHTLKGSARLAGAMRFGQIAHDTESSIELLGVESLKSESLRPLLDRLDGLFDEYERLRGTLHGDVGAGFDADLIENGNEVDDGASPWAETRPTPAIVEPPSLPVTMLLAPLPSASSPDEPSPRVIAPTALVLPDAKQAATRQTVRVQVSLLDRLLARAGEVVTSRVRLEGDLQRLKSALGELTVNVDRLRAQLRDVELQAETQMQSRLAQANEQSTVFDPLELDRFTRIQELTKIMAEAVNDVATVHRGLQQVVQDSEDDLAVQALQSRELQHDLLRTRMVPFDNIAERLHRVVRQSADEARKQVRLEITGGDIELDRGILERMTGAFEHLLRNGVVHGIEPAKQRTKHGKDAEGVIAIAVQQAGNDVSIRFHDDGGGLDLSRIRQRAIDRGLLGPKEKPDDTALSRLVFVSGFTTNDKVTELAGRGVGMDVVQNEVQALGGAIEIDTQTGQGTTFELVLPLTTAVTQVFMVRLGQRVIGVPTNLVETVQECASETILEATKTGEWKREPRNVPFFWAGALLQQSPASERLAASPEASCPVLILRSAAQRLALQVDEVVGRQEVVVRALGPQLGRLPGLVAMTALASGEVVLIYNPVALASVYGQCARAWQTTPSENTATQEMTPAVGDAPLVLVVDDSITIRRITQRLLEREGYRVALAADGRLGLERLRKERPVVVLSDIEMPNMDGFELLEAIRANDDWRDLPVVMITSRSAEKHREHARALGANEYLGKPWAEETLLKLVNDYAQMAGREMPAATS